MLEVDGAQGRGRPFVRESVRPMAARTLATATSEGRSPTSPTRSGPPATRTTRGPPSGTRCSAQARHGEGTKKVATADPACLRVARGPRRRGTRAEQRERLVVVPMDVDKRGHDRQRHRRPTRTSQGGWGAEQQQQQQQRAHAAGRAESRAANDAARHGRPAPRRREPPPRTCMRDGVSDPSDSSSGRTRCSPAVAALAESAARRATCPT